MVQRGRKSAEDTVTPLRNPPEPPKTLTAKQRNVWREVVADLPWDWFGSSTWPMLEDYCRHVCTLRRLSKEVDRLEKAAELDVPKYKQCLALVNAQSNIVMRLGTKLKISQSTRYDRDKSRKGGSSGAKPWQ